MKDLAKTTSKLAALAAAAPVLFFAGQQALADGTEILEPTSAPLADGSRVIGAGVGLSLSQPGNIDITVPAGATVEQVLIYWDGADRDYNAPAPIIGVATDEISVDGNTVEGVFIGGRKFSPRVQLFAFRADITSLGLVSPGTNSISVGGLDFGSESVETGAGLLVIYDDGTGATNQIYDGNDYVYINCTEENACTETVKKMFVFPAAATPRIAELTMFFTSVAGTASGADPTRPSVVRIWVGAAPPIELVDQLASVDGEEWDTLNLEFQVPAGVSTVEVQAFSEDSTGSGHLPASFKWLTAALSVPDEREGGEGCTPGYWKQPHHFADWTSPYAPGDLFSAYFDDAFSGMTLLEVLSQGGGGLKALGRHTVAALLNSANPEVDYDLSAAGVISAFNDVYPGSKEEYNALKNEFAGFNEQGCPLNNRQQRRFQRWAA
jgi:hypothetical protein